MFFKENYNIESKLIRDPIYDFIELPHVFIPIVDHSLFQRLRWISQLPLEQLVYPSAQHSRFEHSLGVMYLAMVAAVSLISNSKVIMEGLFDKDDDFNKIIGMENKCTEFVLSAGLSGLLHDLGHAPFSHTLEEACKYSKIPYKYDHEEIGFFLAKQLLDELNLLDKIFVKKTLKVLNKNLKEINSELAPLENVIRKLIDGPIDVDKGDYIYRDSYHCGTNYGFYDIQRLWRNIAINKENYTIGVNKKGALEAWSLRFQRYKMYKNVYKHHTRNITDSMLIDILATSFDIAANKKPENIHSLIPTFQSLDDLSNKENLNIFKFWTDNSILKEISSNPNSASPRIDQFLQRKIYKRCSEIDLAKYPEALYKIKGSNDFVLQLRELKLHLHDSKQLNFDFHIDKVVLPPVFEKEVQNEIRLIEDGIPTLTLAEFLDFSVNSSEIPRNSNNNSEDNIEPSIKYVLYLYIEESSKHMENILLSEIGLFLKSFSIN